MPCPSVPSTPTESSHYEKGCIHFFLPYGVNNSVNTEKVRPYINISRTNRNSSRVILAPISDIKNYIENGKVKYPYHVPLLKKDFPFLDKDSVILLDQVYTVAKNELWEEWYVGKITNTVDLDQAICYNFDLFESICVTFSDFIKQLEPEYQKNFSRR